MASNDINYYPVQNENEIKVLTKLFPNVDVYTINKLGFIHHLSSLGTVERITQKQFGEIFNLDGSQVKTIVRKRGQIQVGSFGKGVDSVHIEPAIEGLSLDAINQPVDTNNEDTPVTGGEVGVSVGSVSGEIVGDGNSFLVDKNLGVGDSAPFLKELTIEERVAVLEKKIKTMTKIIKTLAGANKEEK